MSPKWWINLLLLFFNRGTVAQETPTFTSDLYSNVTYRQDVCELHKAYYSGEVEFRDALKGIDISFLVGAGSLFKIKDGAIDPEYPGLMGVLMDELALRAGFSWRNSFGIYYSPGEGKSYTDLLIWSSEAYDVTADWWIHTIERLTLGVGFPEGFYDASFILVGLQAEDSDSSNRNLFNWLEPFEASVWWCILGTVIMSALIYMVLESLESPGKYNWRINWNIFLSVLSFTQHFQYHPHAYAARVFSASMAFWSLIIVATYTANLASFFVVQNTPSTKINSIDDAIKASMNICLWEGTGSADYATSAYPQGIFVMMESEAETILGVKRGDCDFALTSVRSWEQLEFDKSVNADCNLEWVGRVVKFVDAGFALQNDAGVKCTSLVQGVLNVHLAEMRADGFTETAWEEHFQKNRDLDCNSAATVSGNESSQLSLNEMAGTFFFHFLATFLAFVISGITILRKKLVTKKPRRFSGAVEELNTIDIHDMSPPGPNSERVKSDDMQDLADVQEQLQELQDCQRDLMRAQDEQKAQMSRMMKKQKAQMSRLMSFLEENLKNDTFESS